MITIQALGVMAMLVASVGAFKRHEPVVRGRAQVWSRHADGKSSMVKFPAAPADASADASAMSRSVSAGAAEGATSSSMDAEATASHSSLESFWKEHHSSFGLSTGSTLTLTSGRTTEMVHVRSSGCGVSGVAYTHHSQMIGGLKVFGGDVVVTTRTDTGAVVRARGHPLPTAALDTATLEAMAAEAALYLHDPAYRQKEEQEEGGHQAQRPGLSEAQALERLGQAAVADFGAISASRPGGGVNVGVSSGSDGGSGVRIDAHDAALEWYRPGLARGAPLPGVAKLAYIMSADMRVGGIGMMAVDGVVCAATGQVLSLTKRGLAGYDGVTHTRARREEEVGQKQEMRMRTRSQTRAHQHQQERRRRLVADIEALNIVIKDCQGDEDCADPVSIFKSARGDDVSQQSEEVQMMVYTTAETRNLLASVSNGSALDYKRDGDPDFQWEAYVNTPMQNAYYSGSRVVFGTGFVVDDVIAHEWMHGYVNYGSQYLYNYQSGALNEAVADMFGEAVDILNEEFVSEPNQSARTPDATPGECTQDYYAFNGRNPAAGADVSRRWVIGEDIPAIPKGIRDMYQPDCFGDPSYTGDGFYYCANNINDFLGGNDDDGGVHYNSGVPNRVFTLLVDGGTIYQPDLFPYAVVVGIGIEKALGLVMESQEEALGNDQFEDWAQDMLDICNAKAAASGDARKYYVPDLENGNSVRGAVVTTADCDTLATIIDKSGMLDDPSDYCAWQGVTAGIEAADETNLCALATDVEWQGLANDVQTHDITGWSCANSTTVDVDPCDQVGGWTGIFCAATTAGEGVVQAISLKYKYVADNLRNNVGHIPPSIVNFANLAVLDLAFNNLEGPLPPIEQGQLPVLQFMWLESNYLDGTIPRSYRHMTNLKVLDLSYNELEGPIPYEICDLITDGILVEAYFDGNRDITCYPSCLSDIAAYVDSGVGVCTTHIWTFTAQLELSGVTMSADEFDGTPAATVKNAVLSLLGDDFSASNVGTPRVVALRRQRRRRLVDTLIIEVELSVTSDTDDGGHRATLLSTELSTGVAGGDFDTFLAADTDSGAGFWGTPTTAAPSYTAATSEPVGNWSIADDDDDSGGATGTIVLGVFLTLLGLLCCGSSYFVGIRAYRLNKSQLKQTSHPSSVTPTDTHASRGHV